MTFRVVAGLVSVAALAVVGYLSYRGLGWWGPLVILGMYPLFRLAEWVVLHDQA